MMCGALDTSFGGDGEVKIDFGSFNAVGFNATDTPVGTDFALARYLGDSSAWVDHSGPLAGTPGLPVLYGTGDLSAGSANSIVLHNANPRALSALFLAFSSMPVPFMGGILQPFPFASVFVATTSPTGTIAVPFTMPSGVPSDTRLWLQWAIQDAGAVQGVALSNAIEGITP